MKRITFSFRRHTEREKDEDGKPLDKLSTDGLSAALNIGAGLIVPIYPTADNPVPHPRVYGWCSETDRTREMLRTMNIGYRAAAMLRTSMNLSEGIDYITALPHSGLNGFKLSPEAAKKVYAAREADPDTVADWMLQGNLPGENETALSVTDRGLGYMTDVGGFASKKQLDGTEARIEGVGSSPALEALLNRMLHPGLPSVARIGGTLSEGENWELVVEYNEQGVCTPSIRYKDEVASRSHMAGFFEQFLVR